MLALLVRTVVAVAASLFYRLERQGPALPPGPVILAANHPNSLLDPILLFRTAGRSSRPLAKAPLFERPMVGRLIRSLGGIPVYRRQDDLTQMDRNEEMFSAATAALAAGDAIQIFPEGRSHSDPALSRVRTGAARIALQAEAAAGWSLGLVVVPVGLTYSRKAFFRGRAVALYGETIPVRPFREEFEADEQEAVRALTAAVERGLRELTLNLTRSEDEDLVDTAERIWAHEHALTTPRERAPIGDRLPRMQAFAQGMSRLRAEDPERHQRLERAVRRYRRRAQLLGAGDGDVPDRYPLGPSLKWVWTRGLPVLLLAPLAAAAAVAWWIPYRLVGLAVDRMDLAPDVTATYKLAGSLIAYPVFLAIWCVLGWLMFGWLGAIGAVALLPLLGALAVRWLDGYREAAQDLRLFLRVSRLRGLRAELAAERRALAAEFDAIRARHVSPSG